MRMTTRVAAFAPSPDGPSIAQLAEPVHVGQLPGEQVLQLDESHRAC
jgi:hypothetical protein